MSTPCGRVALSRMRFHPNSSLTSRSSCQNLKRFEAIQRGQMQTELLDAKNISERLRRMIESHDEIHIAVAWGYNGPLADCLIDSSKKFVSVTFGLAFCQTDPDLVERLIGKRNAYVANSGDVTFHPKLYYFRTEDVAEAIIGSSNFTAGGLEKNWEACVYVKGHVGSPIFQQVRECLAGYAGLRMSVTKELAKSYRLQYDAAKALKKAKHPVLPDGGVNWRRLTSQLASMSWHDYIIAVRSARYHELDERLKLLRAAQQLFAGVASFAELSSNQWKAIAGVIGDRQKLEADVSNCEWGWFGSMKGMGDFASRVLAKDRWLSRALDSIPRHGDITRAQYNTYCEHFLKAFEESTRVGGVPTATRLLAMKRPDTFVCVSNPNKSGLATALSFSRTTLNLDNYWERIIDPIRASPWYNSPRMFGQEAEIWDGRVAMLDAIYYKAGLAKGYRVDSELPR